MTAYITYFRVSTDRQGQSGLGIEAQQEAVRRFLRSDDTVAASYTEIESGRKDNRPQLAAAMAECRRTGAQLLIAKLDRLARDVAFIANLMKSDVRFVAADMPTADPFRLHIEAAIAEEEARKISARTKAALAAARARGVVLGGYRGVPPTDRARATANAARSARARAHAASVIPIIDKLRAEGVTSMQAIAYALTERGVQTPRGNATWQAIQVTRLFANFAGQKSIYGNPTPLPDSRGSQKPLACSRGEGAQRRLTVGMCT